MEKSRFRLNPIIKKELTMTSRSMKFAWELFAYVAVLGIIFLLIFSALRVASNDANNVQLYSDYVLFFPVLAVAQLGIIAITIPIFTASSISGEREKGTLDTLLTTTISLRSIVFGKMMSAVIRVMVFIIASIPIMGISFIVGGIKWRVLFEFLILAFIYAIYSGSIGVYSSARCKKTLPAIILSFVLYFIVYAAWFIPLIVAGIIMSATGNYSDDILRWTFFPQLTNPVVNFVMFFVSRLTSEDASGVVFGSGNPLSNTNIWLILSCIAQLGVAAFFMHLAVRRIDPLRERNRKKA